MVVFWHHASPQIGAPPAPLFSASDRLDIRWVSHDRPGYGGSTAIEDRDVALVTRDVVAVVDALGIETSAVMGHSGGGPHALACVALLPERVLGVVSVAAQAPFDAGELDWFGGMAASNVQEMRAAAAGRAELEAYESSEVLTDLEFTADDMATLNGDWAWIFEVGAEAHGPGGLIEDLLAFVKPWGCDLADIAAPTLLLHGGRDRVVPSTHGRWLRDTIPSAALRRYDREGHISVLRHAEAALDWLKGQRT